MIRLMALVLSPRGEAHRVRALLGVVVTLATLILTGCATFKNTPQQDYVWELGKACDTTEVFMERVNTDGRYYIWSRLGGSMEAKYPGYFACMKEQFKAHPFLDWLKAQKREAQQPPVTVGSMSGVAVVPAGPIIAPVWKVGDEWQYAYKSPSDSGTYVWSVNRIEPLDGVQHYVITTSTREIFHRVSDLAISLERVDGVVVLRETPSRILYDWPLTVGKRWEQNNRRERPVDRETLDRNSLWTVEADETVTVPAGTFRTLKIVWRNKNTNALLYEWWYAPEVKQMVKIREVLTNGIRERELISFKLK
jgi:hypothetical protein